MIQNLVHVKINHNDLYHKDMQAIEKIGLFWTKVGEDVRVVDEPSGLVKPSSQEFSRNGDPYGVIVRHSLCATVFDSVYH
jgi:hypothetical protein